MKIFTKKGIVQKIIIVLVALILFNFIVPNISRAADDYGGVLFAPIQFLVLALGDTVMDILGTSLYGNSDPVITISTSTTWQTITQWLSLISNTISGNVVGVALTVTDTGDVKELFPEKMDLPLFAISIDNIVANEVPLLDVNLINPNTYDKKDENGEVVESSASVLQETVATWYMALRNLAIVGLLSVLVYVGIRIILSSTAGDKAKYKQMFIDWLIGLCLLFFLHYIMSFALTITESLTKAIRSSNEQLALEIGDISEYKTTPEVDSIISQMGTSKGDLQWKTDLMGAARFKAQLNYKNGESARTQMGYTIIYMVLVIYTIMFLFIYLKRLIYITFLTMIAPLVALTYPIDKISDGKAQAFSTWIKEYVFNLLIQPVHLLLYTVLVGSAMDLAANNPLYALGAIGFMLPAEKLLRKMFGFEKASTAASIAGGAVGGAMVMQGVNSVVGRIRGGSSKKGGNTAIKGEEQGKVRIPQRTSDNSAEEEDRFMTEGLSGGKDYDNSNSNNQSNTSENGKQETYNGNSNNPYSNADWDSLDDMDYTEQYMHPELFGDYNDNIDTGIDNGIDDNIQLQEDDEPEVEPDYKPNYLKGAGTLAGKYVPKAFKAVGKTLVKGTAMAVGAGTIGTIGIAAGLASDSYDNVAKFAAGGAAGGAAAAGAVADRTIRVPSNAYKKASNAKEELAKASYSDPKGYQKYLNKKADREFMKDKNVKDLYKSKFGSQKYQEAMSAAIKYREHGVTDNDVIIKAMKVKNKNVKADYADKQRIISAKLSSQISGEKDIETMSKRLKQKGIKDSQIETQTDIMRQIKGLY